MKKTQKNATIDPFLSLSKDKQTFIRLVFEGELTNKEIAVRINKKRVSTVSDWKKKKWFEPAFNAYANRVIKNQYKNKSLKTLVDLLDAKSEMVRLQTAVTILKMSGMISDNSTPELDKAKIRKANAEADIAEYKAQVLKDSGSSGVELLNEYLDKLDTLAEKEVKEDGTKADV